MKENQTSVILLAGGLGNRMGSHIPKQFLPIHRKAMALYSFELFCSMHQINEIIVVCAPIYNSLFEEAMQTSLLLRFALPGERRQDSVYNGLQTVHNKENLICVHDAARPFITKDIVEKVLQAAKEHGASAVGIPAKNTMKQCDDNAFVINTPNRQTLWEIQTPQVLKQQVLRDGFSYAHQKDLTVTDDVSLAEVLGYPVKIVEGISTNIKITTPEDLLFAESLSPSIHESRKKI